MTSKSHSFCLKNVEVHSGKWQSPELDPILPNGMSQGDMCTVTIRFMAALERFTPKGKPFAENSSDEEEDWNDLAEKLKGSDIEEAKSSNTFELHKKNIVRAARPRDVKWVFTKILQNGRRLEVPRLEYVLNRMECYEEDIEMEDEDGKETTRTITREVPSGLNSGLYQFSNPAGTKFQFELISKKRKPFLIRKFVVDRLSATPCW